MNLFTENKDLYSTVFTALKNIGVKVPKIKNIKSSMPKHDKSTLMLDTQMFGVSLYKQEWTQASDNPLPKFLAVSTEYLVKFSTTLGLFRISGSISRQRCLRTKLRNGESLEGSNPNDVASLLKQWLRELPEPLIPYCLHDLFVRCQQLEGESRVTATLLSCLLLPPEHFYSLKHFLCFLKNLAKHSKNNKMDEQNLAIIMAPNIFSSKTESVSKTCNSLVPLHTSVIELLIKNAECVGEVPQSVSFPCSNLDGRRDSELESPAEILGSGSSKSNKKLIARPVQDLFKKLVGQSTLPIPNTKMQTPETSWISPQITCRPVLLNDAEETFSTLKDKEMQVLGIKSKTNRVHRKSFGLLRRKDKKRKKSNRTSSQTKIDLAISRSSNLNSEISMDTMNKTFKVLSSSMVSEEKSPAVQFEGLESNYESVEMSSSECNLAVSSKESSNLCTPKFSLNCPQDSPYVSLYWSRPIKKVQNEILETWQSKCLYADVKSDENRSQTISESKDLAAKPDHFSDLNLSYLNRKSTIDYSYDQQHSSNNGTLLIDSVPNNPLIYDFADIAIGQVFFDKSITHLQKLNNQRNMHSKTKANLYRTNLTKDIDNTCKSKLTSENSVNTNNPSMKLSSRAENVCYSMKTRQETLVMKSKCKKKNSAHQTKSIEVGHKNNHEKCVNLNRSKSFLVDSKWNLEDKDKSNLNTKVPKKTTRQSSLIRGKPNSIKSGLPCHHLGKNPILKQNLVTNNEKTINYNKSNPTPLETNPSRDIQENGNFFSENDISFILNFANLNLSSLSAIRNRESPSISDPKKSPTSVPDTLTLNKEPLPLPLCLKNELYSSDSKIPRLKHSLRTSPKHPSGISSESKIETPKLRSSNSVRATGHSRIPVLSKNLHSSDLETSSNDSCFLTPNKTLFYSPNSITWMSGSKYLSMYSPQEDSFNKRESIALILKNKPGHVFEKVQLYDSQGSKSCSPPVIPENNGGKISPFQQSPFKSSQSVSIQNNRKILSFSQSCDTSTKRTNLKSKNRTSLKLSCHSSKSSINMETLSPNSLKLKEVTNLNLDGKQIPSLITTTPVKDDNSSQKFITTSQPKNCNTNSSKLKLKRNSFSGQTPSKFSKKVSRSESSPSCPRPGNKLFKLRQEPTFNNPNVPLDTNNVHNSSFSPAHSISIKNSGSSLSIQKLKSDEMIDEWQCEF